MGFAFSKTFSPDQLPSLAGKIIIVTGGNAGIGFATIQHLARRGAKVYLGARNKERAQAAIERLQAAGLGPGNGEVVWLSLDYSDPRIAKKAAESFMEQETRLDAVVNSAAMLLVPYSRTHDDIQDLMMVNYLSPFVFIRTLLPILKATAQEPSSDVRIVNMASDGHNHAPKTRFRNVDDLNVEFKDSWLPKFNRYTLSKLMGVLYVKELQRRLDKESIPIIVMSANPGETNTEGVQNYAHSVGPIIAPIYSFIASTLLGRPSRGAYVPVFAAVAPVVRAESQKYRGAYIKPPGQLGSCSKRGRDPELAKELWDTTEKVLSDIGV
ncbi:uncharacterized protein FIBRA_08955 [Fibroporia radiculosa]|uniref:Ketoreductase (KR) domain-containing protein n=1 Tax=Fibroporia radiculosa TaxID=599839 RepID=J4GXP3_9APHY|nr:uncharacterized protein FIBRA_08955 [Fibroporia radiculosa]CCM06670.1 predicted protein [Fibroporia radiculosa]